MASEFRLLFASPQGVRRVRPQREKNGTQEKPGSTGCRVQNSPFRRVRLLAWVYRLVQGFFNACLTFHSHHKQEVPGACALVVRVFVMNLPLRSVLLSCVCVCVCVFHSFHAQTKCLRGAVALFAGRTAKGIQSSASKSRSLWNVHKDRKSYNSSPWIIHKTDTEPRLMNSRLFLVQRSSI